jgi:hypothetical protein
MAPVNTRPLLFLLSLALACSDAVSPRVCDEAGPCGPTLAPAECQEGATEPQACGLNGRGGLSRSCESGQWSAWSACSDPDVCLDNAQEERACSNGNGTLSRSCVTGQWSAWSECPDPNEVLIVSPSYKPYVTPVKALYDGDGHPASIVDALPAELSPYRLILVNNPSTWLTEEDVTRLREFLQLERRLVIVGDHCKFGCFTDTPRLTRLLAELELHASYSGTEGITNGPTSLLPHRLTAGVSQLPFLFTGGLVEVTAPAELLAVSTADQDPLALVERPAFVRASRFGDVVVISDMDMMKSPSAGTAAFLRNLFSVP